MAYPGSHFKNFTAQEVSFSIRGKEDLYYAAIRNGYFLPKFSASIITEDYITDVVLKKLYCPKFKDIRPHPAPSHLASSNSLTIARTSNVRTTSHLVSSKRDTPLTSSGCWHCSPLIRRPSGSLASLMCHHLAMSR